MLRAKTTQERLFTLDADIFPFAFPDGPALKGLKP